MDEKENVRSFCTVPDQKALEAVSEFLDGCVEEFDIPMKAGYSVKVVTDEIFSNIVYYSGARQAEILLRNDADTVTLVFLDDGQPYDPMQSEDPDVTASAEERSIGGLGLFMVKKMAEQVNYEYRDGKNRMTVVLSKLPKKKKMTLEDFDLL